MKETSKNIIPGKPDRIGGNLQTMEEIYNTSFATINQKDLHEIALLCGAGLKEDRELVLKYLSWSS